jgi:hypothetical protein
MRENMISNFAVPAPFQPCLLLLYTQKALIRQKPALLFSDLPDSASIWVYKAISRLKMTANSTQWRGDNPENGLPMLFGLSQKFTQQKTAHRSEWWDFPDPDGAIWSGDK